MEGTYPILLGGEPIGQANVEKRGLYYHFSCTCDLSGEVIYRIVAQTGEKTENLGIPVPEGDQFTLNAKLPVSRIGEGDLAFRAVPRHTERKGKFVPLSPDSPFPYLHRLQNAYLERRNGELGVVLRE